MRLLRGEGPGAGPGVDLHYSPTIESATTSRDESYLGTEVDIGFTWRFAPNAAFDLAGYYLAAGPALKMGEVLNGAVVKKDQQDGYYAAARVRLSF